MPRKKKTEEQIIQDKKDLDSNFKLADIEGIGPKKLSKLNEAGIYDAQDLIIRGVQELKEATDFSQEECAELITKGRVHLEKNGRMKKMATKGLDYWGYKNKTKMYLDSGASDFNDSIGYGYESGAWTELFGEFGSGKTQFCHVAAVYAQTPFRRKCFKCKEEYEDQSVDRCPTCEVKTLRVGGLSEKDKPCRVLWIDTEETFEPDRIRDIVLEREMVPVASQTDAQKKKEVPKEPLDDDSLEGIHNFVGNILHLDVSTTADQILVGEHLGEYIEGKICLECSQPSSMHKYEDHEYQEDGQEVKLVIIDSFINNFRSEYSGGRGVLSNRQVALNKHIRHISRTVSICNVVCIITNQIMMNPGAGMFSDPMQAVGGTSLAHTSTHRIRIRKGGKSKITTTVDDSPKYAKNQAVLKLTRAGVVNGD